MSTTKQPPKRDLIVAPSALRDLMEQYNYPGTGHSRVDLAGRRDFRFWSVGRFLIAYRLTSKSVEIVAVLHGSRDIPAVLRERE